MFSFSFFITKLTNLIQMTEKVHIINFMPFGLCFESVAKRLRPPKSSSHFFSLRILQTAKLIRNVTNTLRTVFHLLLEIYCNDMNILQTVTVVTLLLCFVIKPKHLLYIVTMCVHLK